MRSVVLLALAIGLAGVAGLGACNESAGTLLVIDGAKAGVSFQRVELWFGQRYADHVPTTSRPSDQNEQAQSGISMKVVHREPLSLDAPATSLTYYLSTTEIEQLRLGDYVLAIAYAADGARVGISEQVGFTTDPDALVVWRLELEPYERHRASIEEWGRPVVDCLKWRRARDGDQDESTIALVRSGDVDCDAFANHEDCIPMTFCEPTGNFGCTSSVPCLSDGPPCQLGVCSNQDGPAPRSCVPTTCLVEEACTQCDRDDSPEERLLCALHDGNTHVDHVIPLVAGTNALCERVYELLVQLPNGMGCLNPSVEVALDGQLDVYAPSPFLFEVLEEADDRCLLVIIEPSPGEPFSKIPHLVISFDVPGGPKRGSFVIGIAGQAGACGLVDLPLLSPVSTCGDI